METLDVQGCRSLRWVECTSNSFTSLDFSGCPALDSLDCSDCKPLRSLNVKGCSGLRYLHCSDGPRHLDLLRQTGHADGRKGDARHDDHADDGGRHLEDWIAQTDE